MNALQQSHKLEVILRSSAKKDKAANLQNAITPKVAAEKICVTSE
jgi:hypothetical protein